MEITKSVSLSSAPLSPYQKKMAESVINSKNPYLPLVKTAQINEEILPLDYFGQSKAELIDKAKTKLNDLTFCVLAGGDGSRYLDEFKQLNGKLIEIEQLIKAMKNLAQPSIIHSQTIPVIIQKLECLEKEFKDAYLEKNLSPDKLKSFEQYSAENAQFQPLIGIYPDNKYSTVKEISEKLGNLPKKLHPAIKFDDSNRFLSFIELKIIEGLAFNPEGKIKFLIRLTGREDMKKLKNEIIDNLFKLHLSDKYKKNIEFIEIGNELDSPRQDPYNLDQILLNKEGKIILGSSSHGGTLNILEKNLAGLTSQIFINNIDNLMGNNPDKNNQHHAFYGFYLTLKEKLITAKQKIAEIQTALSQEQNPNSEQINSLNKIIDFHAKIFFNSGLEKISSRENKNLILAKIATLKKWNEKPISLMGMVKLNRSKEAGGGGPVIVKLPDGRDIKVCIEMDHLSNVKNNNQPSDQDIMKKEAYYFNPVYYIFEIKPDKDGKLVERNNDLFLRVERKLSDGRPEVHYEAALGELIGNSDKVNLAFVEVDRDSAGPNGIFRPHKFASDLNRDPKNYGYTPNLWQIKNQIESI